MKKTTKTTAIAILLILFFGLPACQEEVLPTVDNEIPEFNEVIELSRLGTGDVVKDTANVIR